MRRKTLRDMTPDEVVGHYVELNVNGRFERAKTPDDYRKAWYYKLPRKRWQIERARKMVQREGTQVAAGFLRANGWSVEAALWILTGR